MIFTRSRPSDFRWRFSGSGCQGSIWLSMERRASTSSRPARDSSRAGRNAGAVRDQRQAAALDGDLGQLVIGEERVVERDARHERMEAGGEGGHDRAEAAAE